MQLMHLKDALQQFVVEKYGHECWAKARATINLPTREKSATENSQTDGLSTKASDLDNATVLVGGSFEFTLQLIKAASQAIEQDENVFMEEFGGSVFKTCLDQPQGKILYTLGSTLCDFLNSLDNFIEICIQSNDYLKDAKPPSFRCTVEDHGRKLELHYYTTRHGWEPCVIGAVKCAAEVLFKRSIQMKLKDTIASGDENGHGVFEIWESCKRLTRQESLATIKQLHSNSPKDLKISVPTLCSAFPFHFIFDQRLELKQLGTALLRLIGPALLTHGRLLSTYFELDRPDIRFTFKSILCRINGSFFVMLKSPSQVDDEGNKVTLMELKGQMMYLPESNCILFLASPLVKNLEQVKGRGLFLSDIPIHDATRDLILVSEQANAQDGLKKRMEQIQKELQQASNELEEEKKKTEDLLFSIFPHDVANKLINKDPIPARFIQNVTMLFSDIVGFTSICGNCTAMDVVEMLKSLYTKFDKQCEELDLYKVETIGDAYVVAGGVQNNCGTPEDAYKVALMAIDMIDSICNVLSPEGVPLKMRVGIHTGSVLSGVVGTKMPRYCLFGHDVTLANKMESESEAGKINISPVTYDLIQDRNGFIFTARPRSTLPNGFSRDIAGTCYFLEKQPPSNKQEQALWERLEANRIKRKTSPDDPNWDTTKFCKDTYETVKGLVAKEDAFLDDDNANHVRKVQECLRGVFKETSV